MPTFQPSGIIRIGRVPFDNSYKHTMTFGSSSAQESYFSSVCTDSLSGSDYTYVRMNNAIRVGFNAERLYTYNYCMYQNSNYGSKWFYAFITEINYLNENTTELVIETDVMQTWYFDYDLVEGFVEREHVTDDTIGAHLNPEPEMPFDTVAKTRYSDGSLSDCYVIVQTNAIPATGLLGDYDHTDAVAGGFYNRVFSGAKYYAYNNDPSGRDKLHSLLNGLNMAGGAESVSCIFMYPKALCPSIGSDDGVEEDTSAVSYTRTTARPTSLGGDYVPNNNKLFTYPYCYCLFDDNNGHTAEYRYEFWGGATNTYSVQSAIDPTAMAIIAPQNYNGIANNVTEAFTFALCPQCSWVYSSYQNWLAQNSLGNLTNAAINLALMAIPAGRGISAATKLLSAGKAARVANQGTQYGRALSTAHTNTAIRRGIQAAGERGGAVSAGIGVMGMGNLVGEISRQSKIPNTQKGAASGNTLYANEYMTYNVCQVVIREEYARIIDGFFDMYGYQVDSVKVPNRTGRPSWNYVKMQNACHHGNVPASDMQLINDIYNEGITFWHTSDVGNYSLSNK